MELSLRAGRVYQWLEGLFYAPARRRQAEQALGAALAAASGQAVETDEVLLDVPPQATVTAVPAEEFVETVGGFLAAEPLRLDVGVLVHVVGDGALTSGAPSP